MLILLCSIRLHQHLQDITNMQDLPDLPTLLEDHAMSRELRAEDHNCIFSRSILEIPPADRAETFSTGTCEPCFVQAPAVLISATTGTILAVFYLGAGSMGHRGFVHGGVIATVMDECCGRAALCHFEGLRASRESLIPKRFCKTLTTAFQKAMPKPHTSLPSLLISQSRL